MIVLFLCTNYLISVGKNNRYEQPNQEALNILEKSKIYRTDQDGSIMFKIAKKISATVNSIIKDNIKDKKIIENTLDNLLDLLYILEEQTIYPILYTKNY